MKNELQYIRGAGGSDSGSHTPIDSPNTLVSKTTARVLFLTSDGEVGGLADQTNKLKSVYFNNIPVQNADGSMNFANTLIDERYGLPSQTYMPGYPSASSSFNVSTKVTTSAPVIYTSSTSAPDAIRVTIRFPALFTQQSNGDTTGTSVNFQIYSRLGAGAFSLIKDITKTDKCTSPADTDYLIQRPSGTGTWSVKVVRVTADNAATTLANDIYLQTATEIQYAQLPYNNRAYIGMTVTAAATGSSFPLISFDTYGLKIKVPSNYNPVTRVNTGTWDGLFSSTLQVSDNPAWVLYDLLTNARHGMGNYVSASDVDQYSFYDAAVYCDGTVPAVVNGAISGTEPRYTFNYQIMEQGRAWETIQNIAASFGASVYTSGNRVKLVQDRPTGFSRVITNSNVIDGMFEYSSTQASTRSSACMVYWNNPSENWLSVPCYYEDTTGTARYGLTVDQVTGLGITTEGQALRLAKWHVDTSLNNTEAVMFKVGFANAGMLPGEVVKIMDTDYAQVMNEAKVVSSTTSTVTLDRAIAVVSGNTFDVVGSDGITIYTRTITSTGTLSTISFSGAVISVNPNADFILTGAVSPRLFKISNVHEESPGIYTVSAVQYDPNKFGRVDSTPTGAVPVYQIPSLIPSIPLNLAFREGSVNTDNTIRRSLMVSWTRPATGTVKNYTLRWRRASTTWEEITLNTTSYELQNVLEGAYDVQVYARNTLDVMGTMATGSYTISSTVGGTSLFNAPTTLQLTSGGTAFTNQDINFQWTNPSSNSAIAATLKDFEVRFIETAGSTTVRTVYVAAVATGSVQTFSYTYAMNSQDGGPRRSMQVQVRCRDANGNLSAPVSATFTNASPATITPTVTGGVGMLFVNTTLPTDVDFAGFLVWMSTTNAFTPTSGNLVYDGSDSVIPLKMITGGVPHYVRFAAYDSFGKDYAGTGLNLSAQLSASPIASAGIPSGTSVPGTGTEGDLFYNTTDGQLYRYHSGAWTVAVPAVNVGAGLTAAQISSVNAAAVGNGLTGTQIAAATITGSNMVAGTVTASQIAANTITASQIAASTITGSKIAATTITGSNLVANTITAGQIAASTITTSQIAANTITGGNIAASTITGGNIAASTITAGNITVTNLAAISASLGNVSGGQYTTGGFTGYAWPTAGTYGSYLGPSGLLIGNANNGTYFQVDGYGNVYAPGFSIVSGAATFSGALSAASGTFAGSLSAASGTFSGSLTATGVVTAANIVAGGLTSAYSASSTGTSASVSVTIPSGCRAVVAHGDFGSGQFSIGSGKSITYYDGPVTGSISGTPIGTVTSQSSTASSATSPTAGTYTFTASRSGASTYYGLVSIIVLVTNR